VGILKPAELIGALGKTGSDAALDERVSYLVNTQGYLVLHPDVARSAQEENMSAYPIVQDMVDGKSAEATTQQYKSADGRTVVWGALAKVGFAGLSVVTEKSEDYSLAPIKKVLETSGFLGLMILFLAFLFGYLYSFTITSPIQRLVRATQQITEGDFKVVLKDEGSDEIARLSTAFTEMAKGLEERDRVKATFSKFHSKEIAEKLLSGEVSLGGERMAAVIFFSDVRGFTEMSERLQPEEVVEMLNEYMTLMVGVITRNGGVVDKYVGDAIMALWGVPIGGPDDAFSAVKACLEMRIELETLNTRRMGRGQEPLRIGMGLNYGEVIAGNIGSDQKMDYTVIGDSVNLASRIESMTKAYGTDLLISGSVHERVQGRFVCEAAKSARVKGKSNVVEVYHVRGTMDANGIPTIIETPWSTYKASSDEKVMMEAESPSKVLRKPPPFRGDQTGAGFGFNTAPRMVVPPPFRGERTQTLNLPVPSASDPQEVAASVETAAQLIGVEMPVLEEKSKSGTSSKPVIRRKAA
jgi:adenylate cyclase